MSAELDRLTTLLVTASVSDQAIGAPLRSELAAAESAANGIRSAAEPIAWLVVTDGVSTIYGSQPNTYAQFPQGSRMESGPLSALQRRVYHEERSAVFAAANDCVRAAEATIDPSARSVAVSPDLDVPFDLSPPAGHAAVTLLGFVRVTALEPGVWGTTITAEIDYGAVGAFFCVVRRGAFFSERLPITGLIPVSGLLARVDFVGSGSLIPTGPAALAGATGGGDVSLLNRIDSVARVAEEDVAASLANVRAPLAAKPPAAPPAAQSGSLRNQSSSRLLALRERAREFSDYLAAL